MAQNITGNEAIRESAEGGSNATGYVLSAKFFINPEKNLSRADMLKAGNAAKNNMRGAIRKMVRKQYASSGLKVRSGKLKSQALKLFEIEIFVKSLKQIVIEVVWKPTLARFVAHDQGQGGEGSSRNPIRVRKADWLHFKVGGKWVRVKEVKLPKRQIIKMTGTLLNDMMVILDARIEAIVTGRALPRKEKPSRKRATPSKAAVKLSEEQQLFDEARKLVAASKRKPSEFRLRKTLRKSGVQSAKARQIVKKFNRVAQGGILSPAAIGIVSQRIGSTQSQAILSAAIDFQAFVQGGQ